jgi:hypothetical protein
MTDFAQTPLNKEYVFDSLGTNVDLAQAWRRLCDAENNLAEKLKDLPEGTAVVLDEDAWFLKSEDGMRILCHALYEHPLSAPGAVTEMMSRFDYGLDFVDISEGDLIEGAERVRIATEHFVTATIVIPDEYEMRSGSAPSPT